MPHASSVNSVDVVQEAKQITSCLRRIRGQVEADIIQLDEASRTLRHDGSLIAETLDEHAYKLKGALHSTKRRLNAVKASEYWERWSLVGSLIFFTAVVAFIVCRRTRIFKLLWFVASGAFKGGYTLQAFYFPNLQNDSIQIPKSIPLYPLAYGEQNQPQENYDL